MDIIYTDTFFKSFIKMMKHERWYYKVWEFVRYDVWRYFGNIIKFSKVLYNFHPWDSMYAVSLFRKSLELEAEYLENHGLEEPISRNKKIEKIKRAVQLMKWHEKDSSFIKLAEEELGYEVNTEYLFVEEPEDVKEKNRVIYNLANKIEEETWKELFDILKGQDYDKYDRSINWDDFYDGSNLKRWWD